MINFYRKEKMLMTKGSDFISNFIENVGVSKLSCFSLDRKDLVDCGVNFDEKKKKLNVHFSSKTAEWETPQDVFDAFNRQFHFTLDPCCTHENAKCERHFTKEENGLVQDWSNETVFLNPPYGRVIGGWMKKAYKSSRQGATVVSLIPSRTDTIWWHDYATKGEIWFLKGRLKFGGSQTSAPFPSAVVIFRPEFEIISDDITVQ